MPLYSKAYSSGAQGDLFPIVGGAVLFLVISFLSGLDSYIYSREGLKPTKNQKRSMHKNRKK